MDTTVDGTGAGIFAVPGQPGHRFIGINGAPLVNNAGDVVFEARFFNPVTFDQGIGFYSTTTSGGPIVKIVDTFDSVAGQTITTSFENFTFTANNHSTFGASLNDLGEVVYWAQFCDGACTSITRRNGIFGTTVNGAAHIVLADSTKKICPTAIPLGLTCDPALDEGFWEIRPEIALNNAGMVAFHGSVIRTPPSNRFKGTFAVPVSGGVAPVTVAFQIQTAPPATPSAPTSFFNARFDDNEINDAGDYLFKPLLTAPCCVQQFGLFSSDVSGGPQGNVVDTLVGNGLVVPGDIAGSEFASVSMASMNESGQMGFYAAIRNSGTSNNQGIYATDMFGAPISLVMDSVSTPPGLAVGARITSYGGRSAVINDEGHMTFTGAGINPVGTGFEALYALYFYDSCADQVVKISDSTTSFAELGVDFGGIVTGGTIGYQLYQSGAARSGKYTSMNNNGDVAFLAKFSNFGMGIYVAHVSTSGGGAASITCPSDIVLNCPADTSPLVAGDPVATGCGLVTVSSTDTSVAGCGGTETITRTWTANGSVSCDQLITTGDSTAPALSLPVDIVISCGASVDPTNTGQATASDDCDAAPAFTFTDAVVPDVACGQAKIISRTWTATDACGNGTSAVQLITVEDTIPPTLTIPVDVTVECGASIAPSSTGQATIVDNCDAAPTVTSSDSIAPGACVNESVITRTWTGTDACGNTVSGVQTITVVDTTAPALTVALDATVDCGSDTSPIATGSSTAVDNCDSQPTVAFLDLVAAGSCPQASTITRTWTATDACGNDATAVQTIHVVDTTAPVVSIVGAGTVVLAGCVGDSYVEAGATATDNCD
ncbi:MAG: hypothetical protein GXP29_10440, partial [Planctomycetes bacterium]|nr:hypothetical protein [Planctomycetota bacterium]